MLAYTTCKGWLMYYLNALGDVITDEPSLDEMSLRYKIRSLSLMYCERRRKESELIFVHFDVCKKKWLKITEHYRTWLRYGDTSSPKSDWLSLHKCRLTTMSQSCNNKNKCHALYIWRFRACHERFPFLSIVMVSRKMMSRNFCYF